MYRLWLFQNLKKFCLGNFIDVANGNCRERNILERIAIGIDRQEYWRLLPFIPHLRNKKAGKGNASKEHQSPHDSMRTETEI